MSSVSFVRLQDPCLTLNFEVTGTGPNRIYSLPTGVEVLERHQFVDLLMSKYQKTIAICVERLGGQHVPTHFVKFSQWIIEKKHHEATKLDMKGWELDILPPQIALFQNLKELDLSENKLRRLFPELPFLESLEVLDVSGNQVELPDLSHLPKLRIVKANRCGLLSIPKWVSECPTLHFEAEGNPLSDDYIE